MKLKNKKTYFFGALFLLVIILSGVVLWQKGHGLVVVNGGDQKSQELIKQKEAENKGQVSPFSGLNCVNYERRPFAVMLSGDAVTRPLSGLNSADLVVNMPVITNSITRMMAVFVCGDPAEIGSVRSARDDFIPLAQGWNAIYAHWGGSHFALDELGDGILDNLDALANIGNAFYRKSGIEMPHNGFTAMSRLMTAAEKREYNLQNTIKSGFSHLSVEQDQCQASDCNISPTLTLGFAGSFRVEYQYDPAANVYRRFRGGSAEIDKNDGQQIEAKVVAIVKTTSQQIEDQYNDVKITGSGEALVFQNGLKIEGRWQKKSDLAPLKFLTKDGQEIKFTPGQVWVEIVQTNQTVSWE